VKYKYHLVDKDMPQPRLMKLDKTDVDENYASSDVVSIAFAYFLNLRHPSLEHPWS
jgi:hypothetical protein